jgi:hypothetical protein
VALNEYQNRAIAEGRAVRVIRAWAGVRKGDILTPGAIRRAQLLRMRVVEEIEAESTSDEDERQEGLLDGYGRRGKRSGAR